MFAKKFLFLGSLKKSYAFKECFIDIITMLKNGKH